MTRGTGPMTLPFPWTSPGPGWVPWPWNFIYNPRNLLYLSGRSRFQFSIRDWARHNKTGRLKPGTSTSDTWCISETRLGKSTHISMISNSVTHLQSYTNSAIADIAGNSAPISRYLRSIADASTSSADVSAPSADIVASNDECFMMFHNVLRVFHDVLLVVDDVLRCITMFYMCSMMFYYV